MSGFDNDVMYAVNVDFTNATPVQGQVTVDGQLLIGSSVSPFIRAGLLTSSNGSITFTTGHGTLDLKTNGNSSLWQTISASQTLVKNNGYFCIAPGGALSLALPTTVSSTIGDIIEVSLDGATSWAITQAVGQQIRFGNSQTTSGVGGSLTSTAQGDTLKIVYQGTGKWNVISSIGNITIV